MARHQHHRKAWIARQVLKRHYVLNGMIRLDGIFERLHLARESKECSGQQNAKASR